MKTRIGSHVRSSSADGHALAVALAVASFVVLLWRIRYGVDFYDESFYLALPYRFALGDRPFVDEFSPAQTAGFLTVLPVWIYTRFFGTHGIVLFMRFLYVVFAAGVAVVAYRFFRPRFGRTPSLLASSYCLAFVPHFIPALSYNTLGMGFWTIGLLLLVETLQAERFRRAALLAGLCGGLACVAYPTLVPGTLVAAGIVVFLMPRERRAAVVLRLLVGAAPVIVAIALIMARAGLPLVAASFSFGNGLGIRGLEKLEQMAVLWWQCLPYAGWKLPVVIIAAWSLRHRRNWLPLSVVALALLVGLQPAREFHTGNWVNTALGLSGPIVFFLLPQDEPLRRLILPIWVPALCAGLITSYTSGNSAIVTGAGLFPGVLLVLVAMDRIARASTSGWLRQVGMLAPVILVVVLLGRLATTSYLDAPPRMLVEEVQVGPYAKLRTTKERARFVTRLHADLVQRERPGYKLAAFYDFPAAYIQTGMKPALPTVWPFYYVSQSVLVDHLHRQVQPGGVALQIRDFPGRVIAFSGDADLPLNRLIQVPERRLVERPEYAVYSFGDAR